MTSLHAARTVGRAVVDERAQHLAEAMPAESICTEGGPEVPCMNGTTPAHLAVVASGASTIVFTAVVHPT